jgi:transposase
VAERVRVREISNQEGNRLLRIVRRSSGSVVTWRRAQMVLLSAQGMDVAQIAQVTFTSPDRVRDVLHNFNLDGFDSLYPRYRGGRPPTFTLAQRRAVKQLALSRPQDHDLPFSTWSLAKLADFLVAEGVVDDISHEGLRLLLRQEGVSFQARCCVASTQGRVKANLLGSDRQDQFVECDRHSPVGGLLHRQLVVSAAKVLHEGVSGDDHPGTAVLFEPAHRTQPRLQPPMVALDPIVGVPVGAMPGRRQQVLQHSRVHRRLIGGDLSGRDLRRTDRLFEEAMGCLGVAPRGDEDVDDLPELVDGPVDVAPLAGDLHVRLVHLPAISDAMPAGPGGVGKQWREPQHPPVDGDVVDLDATLDEQLLDVAVGQAEAQVPPDRQHDYIRREAEPGEGGARGYRLAGAVSGSHGRSVSARTTSRPTQQSPGKSLAEEVAGLWRAVRQRLAAGRAAAR